MNEDFSYPLRVAADRYGDRPAFVYQDRSWTYAEFNAATDRLAASFRSRGANGRRVAMLLQNQPTTVMAYLALARSGATAVPINPRLLRDEVAFIVEDSGASWLISDARFLELAHDLRGSRSTLDRIFTVNAPVEADDCESLERLVQEETPVSGHQVDPESIALIIYTSGTSGFPKGVMRTHTSNNWACVNSHLGQPRFPDDVEVFVLPLFGIAFIFQVMPMILAGGTTILDDAFDPAHTWELLERHRATRVFLAPTMLDAMLAVEGHEQRDVSSLRIVNTAYEFPDRVRQRAAVRFGDLIAYMYGLTEAQLCVSTPAEFADDPTNAGHPMGMMRVRIVDESRNPVGAGEVGEIALHGPALMSGYHARAEETARAIVDGWLYTGDLGFLDEAGRVHVTGRKKEMIKTGGFSVDPVEVERAILSFPHVREAAVVGRPDEHWGEIVVAFISAANADGVSEVELLNYVKSRIASFKCPKHVVVVPELPKNPMGKIERRRLRALAAEPFTSPDPV